MTIVTFDTIRVDNLPVFSNGNLTVRFPNGTGKAISNKALDNGKFYLEIKLDTVGVAPYIGIFDNNQYTTVFNSLKSDYPPYDNRENLIITTKLYEITTAGDIFSLLIDTINKKLDIYKNNIFFKSYTFNFNNVNIIVGCGYSGGSGGNSQFTVNFGVTPFAYSIPVGYLAYDLRYKFLIKQEENYYSIKDNTLTWLGTPTDDTQKKQWFDDYGVEDLKEALLTPDTNGNKLIDSLDNQFEIRMMKAK